MITKNTRFCLVENNNITKYNLSQSSTGLGVNSPIETYNSKGYYELIDNVPAIDTSVQRVSGSVYEVDAVAKTVTKVYTVVDIPQTELITKKVQQGEQYIKDIVKGVVDAFNTKYGVTFDSIYNMAIYKDDVDYPLHTQCDTLIKWQNSMWATARANQPKVIDGTMTDKEVLAALPVAPAV